MVTGVPAVQYAAPVPEVSVPSIANEVCAPGAKLVLDEVTWKVSGPAADPSPQVSEPPEAMVQDPEQVAAADPVEVPANTTWQDPAAAHDIGLPPLFLTVIDIARGDAVPALREAPTTTMLELAVALLTRL
jgi:hypothetical protein